MQAQAVQIATQIPLQAVYWGLGGLLAARIGRQCSSSETDVRL